LAYYFIVFKADKLELLWAGFLVLGVAGGTQLSNSFIYAAELVPKEAKGKVTTLLYIAPSFIGIVYALSFKFVTKWWEEF
jgi:MFS family permease